MQIKQLKTPNTISTRVINKLLKPIKVNRNKYFDDFYTE